MHHKRCRPKNRRAGCLYCKPHKANGVNDPPMSEKLARLEDAEQIPDADLWNTCGFGIWCGGCFWCLSELEDDDFRNLSLPESPSLRVPLGDLIA
jgi:hypothetical protein